MSPDYLDLGQVGVLGGRERGWRETPRVEAGRLPRPGSSLRESREVQPSDRELRTGWCRVRGEDWAQGPASLPRVGSEPMERFVSKEEDEAFSDDTSIKSSSRCWHVQLSTPVCQTGVSVFKVFVGEGSCFCLFLLHRRTRRTRRKVTRRMEARVEPRMTPVCES